MLFSGPSRAETAAAAQTLEFNVFLENRPIGTHRFDISTGRDSIGWIESTARFDVRILGIRAYRYRHRALERWQDGCLRQIEAHTDDNGERTQVEANHSGGVLAVNRPHPQAPRSGCVRSYAYWDRSILGESQLLNPQTGRYDAVTFAALGREPIEVHGKTVEAERHRLRSEKFTIDLWYSPAGQWLQLDSTTADGRRLRYRLKASGTRS